MARSNDPLLCPFKAYVNLLEVVTGDTDSPVMAIPRVGSGKDNITPLTKSSMLPLFNNLLVQCDLSTTSYSFHSLRHGGATLAAQTGVSELMLMCHDDWRSSCYQTYIKNINTRSFAVSKKMYKVFENTPE